MGDVSALSPQIVNLDVSMAEDVDRSEHTLVGMEVENQ